MIKIPATPCCNKECSVIFNEQVILHGNKAIVYCPACDTRNVIQALYTDDQFDIVFSNNALKGKVLAQGSFDRLTFEEEILECVINRQPHMPSERMFEHNTLPLKENIFNLIATLPSFIEYEGIMFTISIASEDRESAPTLSLSYQIHVVSPDSTHYELYKECGSWYNVFNDKALQGFLYLYERIEDEEELQSALMHCVNFIKQNNLSELNSLENKLTEQEQVLRKCLPKTNL